MKLEVPFDTWLLHTAAPSVVKVIPLDVAVVLELDQLPPSFHADPADRIITATARVHDLPLATRDREIRSSGVVRLWAA